MLTGRDRAMSADAPALLQRMVETAEGYILAADTLNSRLEDFGPAAVILDILGFEIILKAVYRMDRQDAPRLQHDYKKIWTSIGERTTNNIINIVRDRIEFCQEFEILHFLDDLNYAFRKYRYEHEFFEEIGDNDFRERGQKWIASGAPLPDADFRFWPEERYAITQAMKEILQESIVACSRRSMM